MISEWMEEKPDYLPECDSSACGGRWAPITIDEDSGWLWVCSVVFCQHVTSEGEA